MVAGSLRPLHRYRQVSGWPTSLCLSLTIAETRAFRLLFELNTPMLAMQYTCTFYFCPGVCACRLVKSVAEHVSFWQGQQKLTGLIQRVPSPSDYTRAQRAWAPLGAVGRVRKYNTGVARAARHRCGSSRGTRRPVAAAVRCTWPCPGQCPLPWSMADRPIER